MSRLLAYLGPPLRPAPLIERLAEPPTNLPPGGLGLGWLAPDGAAARYLSDRPPPADVNLAGLGRSLESRLWIAYGRDLPGPAGPSPQPLVAGEWLWLLDCEATPPALRTALLRHLTPPSEELLERFDLPELLFTLFRQLLEEDEELTVEEALAETMALTTRLAGPLPLTLNLAVGDGQRLHLVRHATHRAPPALYYTTDEEGFPDGQLATDHPTDEGFWHPIPAGHRLTLDHDEPPDLVPL
ncbi:class II glutamine amidotransferase [Endothiovibrio diazotrophicus]